IDHNVDQHSRCRRRASGDPGAAHFAHAIVERRRSVTPLPDSPAEHFPVKFRRPLDIGRGQLDVANFAVSKGWIHWRVLERKVAATSGWHNAPITKAIGASNARCKPT